jgi:hypothetical protein
VRGTAAAVLGLATICGSAPICAQAESGQKVSFRWRVPTAHYQTVEDSLVFDGKIEEERNTKGLLLVFVFVDVALLPSLVAAILTLRRKLVQPGLKIDARGTDIKIDVDPTLPRGTILLCDKTGCKLYELDQLTKPAELAHSRFFSNCSCVIYAVSISFFCFMDTLF